MTLAEFALPPSQSARAVVIAVLSVAILAAVWIFQAFGYQPCELCLTQRYAFYAAAPLALLTAFAASRFAHRASGRTPVSRRAIGLARVGFVLLAAVFAANAVLAAYHTGVEYHWWAGPTACTGGLTGSLDVNDLAKALDSVKVVRCDEVQLRIAGLSLAGWNVLASAALAVYAAVAARL
jgi:disulfide bond formation protein DsbB